MKLIKNILPILCMVTVCSLLSCSSSKKNTGTKSSNRVSNDAVPKLITRTSTKNIPARSINTKNVSADEFVKFAETLVGINYKYGSADIKKGFDCSGYITYVFNHFGIKVPRSSAEFTNAGKTIDPMESKPGDLVLFTGTDTTGWTVGHMGIIAENDHGRITFLHSASGGGKGVMLSSMNSYFIPRFVKVIRVFPIK